MMRAWLLLCVLLGAHVSAWRPKATLGHMCFTELGCRTGECCVRRIIDGDGGPEFQRRGKCVLATQALDSTIYTVSEITASLAATDDRENTLTQLVEGQEFIGLCRHGTISGQAEATKRRAAVRTASVKQLLSILVAPEAFVAMEVVSQPDDPPPDEEGDSKRDPRPDEKMEAEEDIAYDTGMEADAAMEADAKSESDADMAAGLNSDGEIDAKSEEEAEERMHVIPVMDADAAMERTDTGMDADADMGMLNADMNTDADMNAKSEEEAEERMHVIPVMDAEAAMAADAAMERADTGMDADADMGMLNADMNTDADMNAKSEEEAEERMHVIPVMDAEAAMAADAAMERADTGMDADADMGMLNADMNTDADMNAKSQMEAEERMNAHPAMESEAAMAAEAAGEAIDEMEAYTGIDANAAMEANTGMDTNAALEANAGRDDDAMMHNNAAMDAVAEMEAEEKRDPKPEQMIKRAPFQRIREQAKAAENVMTELLAELDALQ